MGGKIGGNWQELGGKNRGNAPNFPPCAPDANVVSALICLVGWARGNQCHGSLCGRGKRVGRGRVCNAGKCEFGRGSGYCRVGWNPNTPNKNYFNWWEKFSVSCFSVVCAFEQNVLAFGLLLLSRTVCTSVSQISYAKYRSLPNSVRQVKA